MEASAKAMEASGKVMEAHGSIRKVKKKNQNICFQISFFQNSNLKFGMDE